MTPTIDELKNRYYKIVLEKGDAIYSSWGKNRTTSKDLVKKANEYAFDARLKTNRTFRFLVLAFIYALGLRLEKRYGTFWRKLFRLFAFIREREALQLLKRVLGFHDYVALREMIETEIGKILLQFSHNGEDETMGGGKNSGTGELSVEEQMEKFLNECELDDMQKEGILDLQVENVEALEGKENDASEKTEDSDREKISVDEKENPEESAEEKNEVSEKSKTEQIDKKEKVQKEADLPESRKEEKPMEKSVENASGPVDIVITQPRAEEPQSPFPIFQDSADEKTTVSQKEDASASKEQNETNNSKTQEEGVGKNVRGGMEQGKDSFHLAQQELSSSQNESGKTGEKGKEKSGQKEGEISKENLARRARNITMTKRQIDKIVAKLQVSAQEVMVKEEQAWRERISISEGGNSPQTQSQVTSSKNNGNLRQGPKK